MKLIDIQRHFFRIKGEPNKVWFCTEAETDMKLNVTVVRYIRASKSLTLPENWQSTRTQELRGKDINKIEDIEEGLGMAYRPASQITKLDTQVPDSMGDDTHEALAKLKKAVGGDVTDFVCERLQWSKEDIENRLFAEQVDSVALAIYNMEARKQAIIIGDQTGIGKGRMAACLIRYAHVQGQKAVFVTEKPNLFTDIYRDLKDIGCASLKPFIINNDPKANITEVGDNDEIVTVYKYMTDKKQFDSIINSKRVPDGYDYVLATYSQFTTPKRDGAKIDFLHAICEPNTLILDEAHNAGGSSKGTDRGGKSTVVGSNTFQAFAQAVKLAKNVCFLSATFAKRPDNMPLFALRTCISEAELPDAELIESISKGGEALQEIISSELVHEGQMLRRERTYDGIKVNYIYLDENGEKEFGVPNLEKEHRIMSDNITELIREIIGFEKTYISPIMDDMNEELADDGEKADSTNKDLGVSRASYFSKVFNIVNQVLFAIKAEAVADHTIRRLKEGKKVVVAFASTFESMISDLHADDGRHSLENEEINTDYSVALLRGLESTLRYQKKVAKGKSELQILNFDELIPEAQEEYLRIERKIKNTTTGITCSPIDIIIRKIEREGFTCSEVTGRSRKIEFTNEQGTRGKIVNRKREKANVAFAKFQNNQSDVLLINTSGSTGASAHATNKGTNLKREEVKPRVMVIAQYELNVSTEVQKRGRINRTGQFPEIPPSYDYLISAIPAERRMMMMLQKKLRSLDANTASNQKNSTSVIDTDDFINKYGDEVVKAYMRDNEEFTMAVGDPCYLFTPKPVAKSVPDEDIAKKVTGRVAILESSKQEDFYNNVIGNYKQKINQLKNRGEYDLEVEAMKLNAEFVRETPLLARTSGQSVFADAAYKGVYECDVLRKPYTKEVVLSLISKAGSNPKETAKKLADEFRNAVQKECDKRLAEIEEQKVRAVESMRNSPKFQKLVESGERTWDEIQREVEQKYVEQAERKQNETNTKNYKARIIEYFYAGRSCLIDLNTKAICLGADVNRKANNPMAPSNITISFAVANSTRSIDYNIANEGHEKLMAIQNYTDDLWRNNSSYIDLDKRILDDWEKITKEASANRELRDIITGNILKGFGKAPEKSRLISFTMKDGSIRKGVLLPKDTENKNGGGVVVAYKKYPASKAIQVIQEWSDERNDSPLSLSYGFFITADSDGDLYLCIDRTVANKKEIKQIINDPVWTQWQRGFSNSYKNGKSVKAVGFYLKTNRLNLNDLTDALDRFGISVELNAEQAQRFFDKDEQDTQSAQNGEWKKIPFDKSHIPTQSTKPKADDDGEVKRKRAKALMLKMKMAKAKMN